MRRWWTRSKTILERIERVDRETALAFNAVIAEAEPGAYFRTLHRAVVGSAPFGQPVDFPRLVAELALLEQRVADIEDR